jgi:hypothetical protein
MLRILISYRRADSAAYAGRIVDRLRERFGAENVFIDIDTIKPGQDFTEAITQSISRCDAVIAVIGPRWLTETDAAGQRRLGRRDDLVHVEIATALGRGIHVIPVLVGGAEMPQAGDLPGDLSKLARLHALEISDARFHHDVQLLIDSLSESRAPVVGGPASSGARRDGAPRQVGRMGWALGALALVLLVWAASRQLPGGNQAGSGPGSESGSPTTAVGSGSGQIARVERSNTTGTISAAPDGGLEVVAGAPPRVKQLETLGTIDRPEPIDLGVTHTFMLHDVDTAYLSVQVPVNGLIAIMDMQPADERSTNLQSTLSALDRDGGVLDDNMIRFNEIDRGYRKVGAIAVKQPAPLGLKLLNGGKSVTYWLTVFNTSRTPFVPFFGKVTPTPLRVGESVSGLLEAGEDVYYNVMLRKGSYRTIVDFSNTPRANTNIQGYLAILDAVGSNQDQVIRFNEIDVESRKIGNVIVKRDGAAILRLQTVKPVSYTVRIVRAENATDPPHN